MSDDQGFSRRDLLTKLAVLFNIGVATAVAVPLVAYLIWPLKGKNYFLKWVSLGKADDYPENQTRLTTFLNPFGSPWDGLTEKTACWVRRMQGDQFQVFAINCAHLGCPVRWFPQSKLFMCPCHGGAYYADGSVAAGPPPRGLFQYPWRIQSGQLMIQAGQLPTLSTKA